MAAVLNLFIKKSAYESVPSGMQARFIEVVETEIMCLHEGNFARYRLKYSDPALRGAFFVVNFAMFSRI